LPVQNQEMRDFLGPGNMKNAGRSTGEMPEDRPA